MRFTETRCVVDESSKVLQAPARADWLSRLLMNQPSTEDTASSPLKQSHFWIFFLLIALLGIALRVIPSAAFRTVGFDEILYRRYVYMMDGGEQMVPVFQKGGALKGATMTINGSGASAVAPMSEFFLQTQAMPSTECELPPTRFLYIYTSWLWKRIQFGDAPPLEFKELNRKPVDDDRSLDPDHRDPALVSLHNVACAFSVLLLIASGLFAWRMLGQVAALGVLALMAGDPVQLHFSQHALIDGFFMFWALMCLWTTWENLRNPNRLGWLLLHGICLALMVMTKENSFFVYIALAILAVMNRWMKWGQLTPRFLAASVLGPLAGVLILMAIAGGPGQFVEIYKVLVSKAQGLVYAQVTGDGPWYRYLIDLMIVSPIILCLALGGMFRLSGTRKEYSFLCWFVVLSYAIMCNIKYGMNLRYASIWEFSLRVMAFAMIWNMAGYFKRQAFVAVLLTTGLFAYEFRQFQILAMNPANPLYELAPSQTLRLIKVIKDTP